MTIDDHVLDRHRDDHVPTPAATVRRTIRTGSDPIDLDTPPAFGAATDPGSIADALDWWAAEHDRLTERYGHAREEYAAAKADYELACAKARRVARSAPEKGRRTVADIDGEVTERTEQQYRRYLDAEADVDVLKRALWNASAQLDRLRTHASTARTFDPRGA